MKIEDKRAFILIPFSNEFENVYRIIESTLLETGFQAESAKGYSGDILQNIVRGIVLADIIIADISGLNANVMYELGIAHALKKPVILLSQDLESGRNLPFNISHYKTIGYSKISDINDSNANKLKIDLKKEIYNFLTSSSGEIFNPFSKAISADKIVLSNLFRHEDYPFLKGYLDVLEITSEAEEVWTISRNLYWERKDQIYLDRIFDNIIQGKRRQLIITHSNNKTEISTMLRSIRERKRISENPDKNKNLEENFRVVYLDNDFIFKFIINEITIYNPLKPYERVGIILQPMEPFPQHEENDKSFIQAIRNKNSPQLKQAYLRERTFDIMLNSSIVDEIVKGFIEIWNNYCDKDEWKIELE